MQLRKRLLSLALSLVLVLPITLLLSPAPVVSAQTTSTLYGTGSADEINIIRLLDMALNKGGMSMSPSTIQAFLEYWWDSVVADLNTCIGNADSAISTTQVFADYIVSALDDCEHYDKLGDIIKRYVQYVLTLDYKSLSDFKQLLTQEGTFRKFLLSYIVDDTGNIASTVNNKLAKYSLKSGLVNMVRRAADAYIEEYEGYFMIPTYTYKDVSVSWFPNRELYDFVYSSLKTISAGGIFGMSLVRYNGSYCFMNLSSSNFVIYSNRSEDRNYSYFPSYLMSSNWDAEGPYYTVFYQNNALSATCDFYDLSDVSFMFDGVKYTTVVDLYTSPYFADYLNTNLNDIVLFTSDGRSVKWWKSLDAFKQSTVGKSNIYYSNTYSSFDSSVDNSVEFSGSYYSNSYSHDVIQNTIDNSSEVNESTVNNIVNNYITNNYGDGSGSGSGSGDSGDDWWNIGDGITAFIEGVAKLLDFLLKLLGDLIGVISDFLVGLLAVLKELGVVGSSFGDFLAAFFGFLPEEIISMIVSGIGLLVVAGIIKVFKG